MSPDFYDDPALARCSHGARLLFPALWQLADRCGVFELDPAKIRKYAFGYDDISHAEIVGFLNELLSGGFILRATWQKKEWGLVRSLPKRQRFHKDEKEKHRDVVDAAEWCSTTLAPPQHHLSTVPNALSLETGVLSLESGDLGTVVEAVHAEQEGRADLPAAPSAPAGNRKKRSPDQVARSLAVNRRYRERYEEREGHPPTGMDQQANGIIARFADKHAGNALAILDWFFDSPDGGFKKSGWALQLLFDQAPRLWRELHDKRKALENIAAPVQARIAARNASNDLELERANAIMARELAR